ncbi:type 2 periplasmic-binding domain-containing protein [Granulicella tundricola]|uniref:Uncharacterized protein n=1 Tax=Granulicella tundricola (strain ATCC BAA-1859 / DSM 23138 / MP5ACTX9) TaxID=1198114 RepID=E8WZC4_GRATM|nr:transporter substrate-binding domain-containing protein [Granulicella tundricola]ADW68812.1 hypothetical protein AciX9_1764 [Granulicella tundricola MP5ACTX9]
MLPKLLIILATLSLPACAQSIETIRTTKLLRCAIDQEPPEYTTEDLHGPRVAFDLELCHAVALAIGPDIKVQPILVSDEAEAISVLKARHADLAPTLSLNLTNATTPGLWLGLPIVLDGTGFMVPTATLDVKSLSGKKICFFAETETETILKTWFTQNHLDFLPYPFSEEGEMDAAYTTGNCAAMAGDLTRLASTRQNYGRAAARYKLLPTLIASAPLAPASTDPTLTQLATWTNQLLLNAEALNITHIPEHSQDPAIQRLLGQTHELGPRLHLDDAWPIRVLTTLGNYADLYARTLPTVPLPHPTPLPLD